MRIQTKAIVMLALQSVAVRAFSFHHARAFNRYPTFRQSRDAISLCRASSSSSSSSSSGYDVKNAERGIVGTYDPASFETEIYQWWEDSGCFSPDAKRPFADETRKEQPSYVLPMPPPNVTGKLHMGHAIFVALQDVLARFHRMRGRPTLWLPGTDHAGIATQLQVEKLLAEEGKTREGVGREAFLEKVWEYKAEQGGSIVRQLRSLGASADWSRERFTMDEMISPAVVEAFVQLHEKGLVYKGEYMVNWAPGLQTAVSDLEVEYSEEEGTLFYFDYPVADEDNLVIPVATTRPETILGDTAVCVHPEDDRYKHLIGKECVVPFTDRKIPIIADEYVDREFGTGALKITPGHDINDYQLGKKHNLEIINIMNKDGSMNENAGERYVNLDRFECRSKLWKDMEDAGIATKSEKHTQRIPRSQRGGEVIEPMVSSQWFVKAQGMGDKAMKVVEDGEVQIVPKRFEKIWFNWLTDLHDWCISRQLWWGHRIPVYYTDSTRTDYIVARSLEDARSQAEERGLDPTKLEQEEDVLDTWFSSGLWPFATLGWPNQSDDLAKYFPGTCLETGYDILFFWVARMAMMSLELTGKAPFDVIYLHGLVRAADGSKMSKTKGNVVDPLDVTKQYGADSLRYSLVTGVTPGQDIPLNMDKIVANASFANKLWNICKFVTDNALKDVENIEDLAVDGPITSEDFDKLGAPEQYIISKCHTLVYKVTEEIEAYNLGEAGRRLYEFLWDEFADWYVEVSKTRLYEGAKSDGNIDTEQKRQAQRVLVYILDTSLRVLHPYMPYVTEQLWHHLPRKVDKSADVSANALMLQDWPQMKVYDDEADSFTEKPLVTSSEAEIQFDVFKEIVRSIRNARAEYNVDLGKKIPATIVVPSEAQRMQDMVKDELDALNLLAKLDSENVKIVTDFSSSTDECVQLVVRDGIEVYLPLSGLIDPVKERQRLERQDKKLAKEIEKLSGRLQSKGFVDKAPEVVVAKARDELAELEDQAAKIKASLDALMETVSS